MSRTYADRREERQKSLGALDQAKEKHKYLADSLALLTASGAAVEAAEPGIGLKAADFHDAVARRATGAKAVPGLLIQVRKNATLNVTGKEAQRVAAHYLLDGETQPASFAAKEASLKFLIGALTGHTEPWAVDAHTKAEALLHDLQGATVERARTKTGTDAAHAAYAKAAADWDKNYQVAELLVSAAALLLGDASLHDAIIWTHPRHHPAETAATPDPAPAPKA